MLTLSFDLRQLIDREAFYYAFAAQSDCPAGFGNNLDALWDWLTGGMALPATIHLLHAERRNEELAPVVALLEEAAQSLAGELRLIYG
ncbi:barstar family protein [uncultured Pantoea sp.]|uniref:barstar family protein n=1 Tax=uncultured Pantoea sp. TaxID=218084 RepID=UPI002583A7BA|nr:barstar family protein [uncultured Pantoea sp.]